MFFPSVRAEEEEEEEGRRRKKRGKHTKRAKSLVQEKGQVTKKQCHLHAIDTGQVDYTKQKKRMVSVKATLISLLKLIHLF